MLTHRTELATLLAALKECGLSRDYDRGKGFHSNAVETGLASNVHVATSLINMYSKCGSTLEAREVFDSLVVQPDVVTWTSLIQGYVEKGENELAFELFEQMEDCSCSPKARTYAAVVAACSCRNFRSSDTRWLERGRYVHSRAVESRCCDVYVENRLIDMYSRLGSMAEARSVFEGMFGRRDVVSWTALIQGYVENHESEVALELFFSFQLQAKGGGCVPNARTYVAALKACAALGGGGRSRWLQQGQLIHSLVVKNKCCDIFVESTLVDMYAKLGNMLEARKVFDKMERRNVVVWNALLQGYLNNGEPETVAELFDAMHEEPNAATYLTVLTACAALAAREPNGSTEKLKWLQKEKAVYSRSVSMKNLVQEKPESSKAICASTFLELLKECTASKDVKRGRELYKRAAETGLVSNTYVFSSLINMFARCGSMVDAQEVYDGLGRPDVVATTCLIQGYQENKESERALRLFEAMHEAEPDAQAYVAALSACTSLADEEPEKWLEKGKLIHARAVKNCWYDQVFVQNALVALYSRCRKMELASEVFGDIKSRNLVSWNTLIQGYAENGQNEKALQLFERVERPDARTFVAVFTACADLAGKEEQSDHKLRWLETTKELHAKALKSSCDCWDVYVETRLIKTYSECRSMVEAQRVFENMAEHRNPVAWNCLAQGYVNNGECRAALDVLSSMMECVQELDAATFVAAVMACRGLQAGEAGRHIHAEINRFGLEFGVDEHGVPVATCLMEFYGKCGKMSSARHLFDSMSSSAAGKDVWTWNSLMAGYTQQGDARHAVELFHQMAVERQALPNRMTFISLLSACSHAGLVEEGRKYFKLMKTVYSIEPDVTLYNCLVDLLARANVVDEAMETIRNMPVDPNAVSWTVILEASRRRNGGSIKLFQSSGNKYNDI